MALTVIDRSILQRCFKHDRGAWNDFVDRYLGIVYHVIRYTAHLRSHTLSPEAVEDIAEVILAELSRDDYALLRHFRGNASLGAYLVVTVRRIAVRELVSRAGPARKRLPDDLRRTSSRTHDSEVEIPERTEAGIEAIGQIDKLLQRLPTRERKIVQMFFLEGRTHEEISTELNLPVTTIGSVLKRSRKMLQGGAKS